MIAEAMLKRLEKRDIKLYLEDENLKWRAPEGRFTMEMKEMVKQYKKVIVEYLSTPRITAGGVPCQIIRNDCKNVLTRFPENSIDCIITDPPYGLKFMNKDWDKAIPEKTVWEECLRILKPGAFAFVMCAPRQDLLSRMIIRLMDAGFTMGFSPLYWTYCSGFPKASSISNQIRKKSQGKELATEFEGAYAGFQPKPAVEVILMAMKPLTASSYTSQAIDNGKGLTWLDDCRIPYSNSDGHKEKGRFPANLLVSDNVLDTGIKSRGGYFPSKRGSSEYFGLGERPSERSGKINDIGDYSRYFSLDAWRDAHLPFLNVKKASQSEKDLGLEGFEEKQIMGRDFGQDQRNNPYKIRPTKRRNVHPTVKPIELIAYLITMGSREGDIVLDPFCGSGTTCVAAMLLKRKAIGIEIDDHYFDIATARVRDCNLKSYN